jgi:hypothetical protein
MFIVPLILVVLLGVGVGVAAYNAGERNGTADAVAQIQTAQSNGESVQVVHVVDDGHHYFFPGFFLFPLFLFGGIFLIAAIARGAGRWGGHGPGGWYGPGPWNEEGRKRFEERAREWHRQEHGDTPPPAPTTAA